MGGATGTRGETVRGDRDQRRRDVLAAAATVLEERGWDEFSIREVAAQAGVSGGAVYQWFSGKGEIWARLQAARFAADVEEVDGWPADLAPGELVHRLASIIASNHGDLGRHRFEFERGLRGRVPPYAEELAEAHATLSGAVATRLLSVYIGEPPANHAARVSWFWAVAKGIGDHLVDSRFEAQGVERALFLETAAECLLAGLRAESPATVRRATPDDGR